MSDQAQLETAIANSTEQVAEAFGVAPPEAGAVTAATATAPTEQADTPLLHEDNERNTAQMMDESPSAEAPAPLEAVEAAAPLAEEEEVKYEEQVTGDAPSGDEDADDGGPRVLYRLYDFEQEIPKKVHGKEAGSLNNVDLKWRYNITLGDMEFRRIVHDDRLVEAKAVKNKVEEIWFPMEQYPDGYDPPNPMNIEMDPPSAEMDQPDEPNKRAMKPDRKVFVALKVKRVSDVDNIKETFRMRFHIYFNWLMTEGDYTSYLEAKADGKLVEWEPRWYPHLEFQNSIDEEVCEWEEYPDEGKFRMQIFKDFGQEKKEKRAIGQFDCSKARFIRAKLECEMTFAEELELQSFPFDCQDLSCIIQERTTSGVSCVFLPELRKPKFGSIDPRYSVIDEWDLETAVLEFGDTNNALSRSKSSYAMIVLRLKVKRRWKVFFANIVFLMCCISLLGLTAFSLKEDDLGDRLNLLITLILTAVAFGYIVTESIPNVPYQTYLDKYVLSQYAFLVVLMFETACLKRGSEHAFFMAFISEEGDRVFSIIATVWVIVFNIAFFAYGWWIRRDEVEKMAMSSDEIEREVNQSRPGLLFNYMQRERTGEADRLLSFTALPEATAAMTEKERKKFEKNKLEMEKLHTRHGSALGEGKKGKSPK